MIEFVCIYWELRQRWTVQFANGASLTGDQLRTLQDAESAALEVLGGVPLQAFSILADQGVAAVRYRPVSWRVSVRGLDDDERMRVRECLEWLQHPGIRTGEPADPDDESTRARYDQRLEEARTRWPDVARLIGF